MSIVRRVKGIKSARMTARGTKRAIMTLLMVLAMVLAYAVPGLNPGAVSYAETGMTQDEAIEWLESQLGNSIDYDGVYGAQCVDLTKAYYAALGVDAVKGNGCDYATNALPEGWTRVAGGTPEKGDILVYSGSDDNPYGHVAIYDGVFATYHQNFNGHSYVEKVTAYSYTGFSNHYWGYIRPDWKAAFRYADLGTDFRAAMILTDTMGSDESRAIVNSGGNAELGDEQMHAANHWYFTRQEDGSYVIESLYDHTFLTAVESQDGGVSIACGQPSDSSVQQWFLCKSESSETEGYRLVPAYDHAKCVTGADSSAEAGASLQISTDEDSAAQVFTVCKFTDTIPTGIYVTSGMESIDIGDTFSLEAVVTPEGVEPDKAGVKWESSDDNVAAVTSPGEILGVGYGTATIKVSSLYNEKLWAECTVTVACSHSGTEIRNSRQATASQVGYTGDTYCTKCGALVRSGSVIPKTGGSGSSASVPKSAPAAPALRAGDKASSGGCTYKVTSPASLTVEFVKAKNKKTVTVPDTVALNGRVYKVTGIGAGAFTGKKIRTVKAGANVTKIRAGAFRKSKATRLILRTKLLKKEGVRKSLKGSKIKTIQVKVGNKKANKKFIKKYRKLFTKKITNCKTSVKIL